MTVHSHTPPGNSWAGRLNRLWRNWASTSLSFQAGSIIVAVWLVLAVIGPWVAPYGPSQMGTGLPLSGASFEHPFGTDQTGRDVFSRVLHGAPIVIGLSLAATIIGLAIGTLIGMFAGFIGGWLDDVLMRLCEVFVSIPFVVLGMLIVALAGNDIAGNVYFMIVVVAAIYVPRVARMTRSVAAELSTRDYVAIARLRGQPVLPTLLHEIVPNASGILLVEFAVRAGYAPILIGSLGFLGFGVRPPLPEWGLMISENRSIILLSPITVIGPGIALASLVIGLNLLTDGFARIVSRSGQLR